MLFNGSIPENIHFGRKCRHLWKNFLIPGKVLLVCGRHSVPILQAETAALEQECKIVTVSGELPLSEIEAILNSVKNDGFTNIVGWGGGSAMDGAKALAALITAPLPAAEYFYCRAELPKRECRLILIPTTAGTGAEITANAVICDHATNIKQSLRGPGMTADAALVDPELLEAAPEKVTVSAAFDALTQALESFTSARATPLTRSIAATAAALILQNLETAVCRRTPAAFDALARGSMLTGIAFAASGLGAVHGLAHPLGSLLSIPHGECCAILLLPVLKRNSAADPELFTALAQECGYSSAEALFTEISVLQKKFDIPQNFKKYGLTPADYDFIVKNCRSGSMKCNRKFYSDDDVRELLGELA